MKCPERYAVMQHNIRKPIFNDDNVVVGEHHMLVEMQEFCQCYKEQCAAWDKENCRCRKMND